MKRLARCASFAFSAARARYRAAFLLMTTAMDDRIVPKPQPEGSSPPKPAAEDCQRDVWRSEELLGNRAEVTILHNNETYRLRRTRQGKLILYK
jgi:hemin uptake protein HemP